MKFCVMTLIDPLKCTQSLEIEFLKMQNDGRPPFWKTIKSPQDDEISTVHHQIWYDDAFWLS